MLVNASSVVFHLKNHYGTPRDEREGSFSSQDKKDLQRRSSGARRIC